MSLFLGRQTRSWIAEPPLSTPYASHGSTAWAATPDGALVVPTVYRCVSLLANAVAMLTLEHYRYMPTGLPKVINRSGFVEGLTGDLRQSEWLHMLMVSLLLRGNGLGRVVSRDSLQRPRQVALLNPDSVRVEVDHETGRLTYKLVVSGKDITADIWHVRGMTLPGSMIGLSPISYAAAAIGVDLGSRQFAQDFFTGGGIPKAVLTTDQDVNQQQARTIKDRLLAATRSREPVVLGRGLDYKQISVNPEESQFLLTQQANISQIAGYFGPTLPVMVGGNDGSSMTYSNRVDRANDFLTYDVQTWLTRIQDAVTALLPANEFVRFNTSALLRMDARTQAEVDNMQLAGKTRVPSELRERDGLPPMTDAQMAEADMVPLTITPSGGAKALPPMKAPPGAEAPVPVGDVQQNSAPHFHYHAGDQEIVVQPAAPAEVRQQINVAPAAPAEVHQAINVAPAAPAEVRQDIHVQAAAPAEVRLEQPINVEVQPSAPAEVRMVTVGGDKQARSRRIERDDAGEVVRIVEE